jgi:hypothetical protein
MLFLLLPGSVRWGGQWKAGDATKINKAG